MGFKCTRRVTDPARENAVCRPGEGRRRGREPDPRVTGLSCGGDGRVRRERRRRGVGTGHRLPSAGCPRAQGWARGREGVSERTEREGKRRNADLPGSGRAGWRILASAQTVLGHGAGRPAFALCWSALRGASSTDRGRVGPPTTRPGDVTVPGL